MQREIHTGVTGTERHDDLTDVDTGNGTVGLTPSTTHTSLKSIGTSARQHLVDTDDVEGVGADTEVETLLTGVLDEVLVGANTGGLEGLGAQLLILVGDEVDAEREVVDNGTLAAKIEDANLGVGDTTVEARLGVRLYQKRQVSDQFSFASHFLSREEAKFSCPLRELRFPSVHCLVRLTVDIQNFFVRPVFTSLAIFGRFASGKISQIEFILPCSCSSGSNERDDEPS